MILGILPQRQTAYLTDGADFDGSSDYMARGGSLTGISSSKTITLSAWIYVDVGASSNKVMEFIRTSPSLFNFFQFQLAITGSNVFFDFSGHDGTQVVLRIATNQSVVGTGEWFHILMSVDLADTNKRHIYINDVDYELTENPWNTYINSAIEFSNMTNGYLGTSGLNPGVDDNFNGGMAELWFNTEYIDLSVEANRRKFIDADGKPVNLGDDGSEPTGNQPLVYLRIEDGGSASDFATNLGTGGNFSITGSLGIRGTSPSD